MKSFFLKWFPFLSRLDKNETSRVPKKILRVLIKSYQNTQAGLISWQERQRLSIDEDAYIYGEIEWAPFYHLFAKTQPLPHEIFYDLGSGSGKAVLLAGLAFELAQSIGIERLPALCAFAMQQKNKMARTFFAKCTRVEFIQNDFLEQDFSNGDIIFVNATCLSWQNWQTLQEKFHQLKPGSRIILSTKKIEAGPFELMYADRIPMSWGWNTVHIYKKTATRNICYK